MTMTRVMKSTVASVMLVALAACTSSPNDRRMGVVIDDTAITAKVKTALAADPDVKARDVQVETYRGNVQLSGFVDSPENIRRALDIARRVEGVREVQNALIVK